MKMIDHNHFICHLILGTFTEYPLIRPFLFPILDIQWKIYPHPLSIDIPFSYTGEASSSSVSVHRNKFQTNRLRHFNFLAGIFQQSGIGIPCKYLNLICISTSYQ